MTRTLTSFTPLVGSAYSGYGNCYYEVYGSIVHIHIGIQGLTANTTQHVYTMPTGLRPSTSNVSTGCGSGIMDDSKLFVSSEGKVEIRVASGQYAEADVVYLGH